MNVTAGDHLRDLIGQLTASNAEVSPRDQYLSLDLNLKVIALMAACDGGVDATEVRLLRTVHAADASSVVSDAAVHRAVEAVTEDQESVWRELAAARLLEPRLREHIYLSARQTAVIDGDLHEQEAALLQRIGELLGLSHERMAELDAHRDTAVAAATGVTHPDKARALHALMNSRGGRKLRRIFGRLKARDALTPELQSLAMDLTIKAIALVSSAEESVQEAEVRLMGEIYAALGGGEVPASMVNAAVDIVRSDTRAAWEDFHKARHLDIDTRRHILQAACSVAHADQRLYEQELEVLTRLGRQLGFSEAEVTASMASAAA